MAYLYLSTKMQWHTSPYPEFILHIGTGRVRDLHFSLYSFRKPRSSQCVRGMSSFATTEYNNGGLGAIEITDASRAIRRYDKGCVALTCRASIDPRK
jgi:hypothetical protein